MALTLEHLPAELLDHILQYLPISDLLSFAQTSRSNYQLSTQSLTTLDLAVFPRRIHSLLAFFDAGKEDDDDDDEDEDHSTEDPPVSKYWTQRSASDKSLHQVGLITNTSSRPSLSRSTTPPSITTTNEHQKSTPTPPPTALSLRTHEINTQNTIATQILNTPTLSNLRTLTLRLYDLTSPTLAKTLATQFPHLTNLTLEFSHPYIHDPTLPAKYWREPPPAGSPLWNTLSGLGDSQSSSLNLHSLRSLTLTRSGITSVQLRRWISTNPHLRSLRLSLCRGVDADFLTWLAEYIPSSALESISLTDCGLLDLSSPEHFESLTRLCTSHTLRTLSVRGCKLVDDAVFLRFAEDKWIKLGGVTKLVSPRGVVVRPTRRVSRGLIGGSGGVLGNTLRGIRPGSVSPALSGSDSGVRTGALGYFGKPIEVDPNMTL